MPKPCLSLQETLRNNEWESSVTEGPLVQSNLLNQKLRKKQRPTAGLYIEGNISTCSERAESIWEGKGQ